MKLSTLTIFLATAATTSVASPLVVKVRDLHEVANEVSPRHDPKPCKEVSPGTKNVKVYQTQHRTYRSSGTDVGANSLFSYQRPTSGSKYGTLIISNGHSGRKVIEFWSGKSRISFEVYGRQDCTARLSVSTIDHYRVW